MSRQKTVICTLGMMVGVLNGVAFASDTAMERPNVLSIELGGRAGAYSIQYDYQVAPGVALGLGGSTLSLSGSSVWEFPIYANVYLAPGPSRFYATAGVTAATGNATIAPTSYLSNNGVGSVNAGLGYEYRGETGVLFRIAAYGLAAGSTLTPWAGLSLGAALP